MPKPLSPPMPNGYKGGWAQSLSGRCVKKSLPQQGIEPRSFIPKRVTLMIEQSHEVNRAIR